MFLYFQLQINNNKSNIQNDGIYLSHFAFKVKVCVLYKYIKNIIIFFIIKINL